MADRTIFILGASRGIGLGLVKEFLARGWQVVASERSRSDALHALESEALRIVSCDVTRPDSYADFGFEDGQFDALVINAGVTGARHQDAMQATADEVADVMVTNAFGPALRDGGTLAVMSSLMGSISDSSGGYDLYRTSKVALNMLAKGVAEQHAAARGIAVLALHPGWVQTDMGGPQAKLTIDESVNGLADVLEGASGASFRFVDYKGDELAF